MATTVSNENIKNVDNSKKLLNLKFPFQDEWDIGQDHLTFEIKNMDLSFVNSLERIILSNIPAVGFNVRPLETSDWTFYKNNTPFENEFISHRIGLIPIHLNPDSFDPAEYSFFINKENSSKDYLPVTSEDIQVLRLSDNQILDKSQTRKIFPADPLTGGFISITKIIPWEDKTLDKPKFHCEGKAMVSTGIENAAFSNVSVSSHSFKIDPKQYEKKFKDYVKNQINEHNRINKILKDNDPEFEVENFDKSEQELKKKFDLLEAERCFHQNEDGDPTWFEMIIESVGIHSPVAILEKGLEVLIKKVSTFKELIENPIDEQIEITKGYNNMDRAFRIRVYNENETLGNLIAAHLRKFYIDENEMLLSAVGFNKIHPLDKSVIIFINPAKNKPGEWGVIREYILETCTKIISMSKDLIKELQSDYLYKSVVSKKSKKHK